MLALQRNPSWFILVGGAPHHWFINAIQSGMYLTIPIQTWQLIPIKAKALKMELIFELHLHLVFLKCYFCSFTPCHHWQKY